MEQPTSVDLVHVQARLASLERSSARWRRVSSLALGGWVLVLAVAATPASHPPQSIEELTVRKLRLVDESGTVRAELSLDAKGRGGLYVLDPAGRVRAEVTADSEASLVMLRDVAGRNRLGLAVDTFPHLMLHDEHQKPRIHAAVGITNSPSLVMIDESGVFAAGMGLDPKGKPWITPLLEIGADADGRPVKKGTTGR